MAVRTTTMEGDCSRVSGPIDRFHQRSSTRLDYIWTIANEADGGVQEGGHMTNRWTTMLLAVALLIVATASAALAGPKGIDRPIEGVMHRHRSVRRCRQPRRVGEDEGLQSRSAGVFSGHDLHECRRTGVAPRRTHLESAHCNTPTGPGDGQMAFVAANGDVLYAEYTGEYTDDGIAASVVFTENTKGACYLLNDVPCVSSGRFQGATGSVVMSSGVHANRPER